ncbi:hypothetical protein SS50377_22897 [Spironucleus salmonicida]|uniref:Uncharacterized protein n=1 Tax=Spironucleus salmonicida TaxID=348837 RepID=A0A9P8RZW9_9EUKA|nr:hypothetical protein SS50377_22897 [Spironucleus salmonicida]
MGNCITTQESKQCIISEQINSQLPEKQQSKLFIINIDSMNVDNNITFTTRNENQSDERIAIMKEMQIRAQTQKLLQISYEETSSSKHQNEPSE